MPKKTLWPWCSSELHSHTQINKIYILLIEPTDTLQLRANCVRNVAHWYAGTLTCQQLFIIATGEPTWFIITIKSDHISYLVSHIFWYIQLLDQETNRNLLLKLFRTFPLNYFEIYHRIHWIFCTFNFHLVRKETSGPVVMWYFSRVRERENKSKRADSRRNRFNLNYWATHILQR